MGRWINKVGVELEVGVIPTSSGGVPQVEGLRDTTDGSITTNHSALRAREYVSQPCEVGITKSKKLDSPLKDSIEELYNHVAEVNTSMGLHIHVSMKQDRHFEALSSMDFYKFFGERVEQSYLYKKNETLQDRWEGASTYAQEVENHIEFTRALQGNRRSRYRHFIPRTEMGTIEFRLFPAMDNAEDVIRAIKLVVQTINSYIYNERYKMDDAEEVVEKQEEPDLDKTEELEKVIQRV